MSFVIGIDPGLSGALCIFDQPQPGKLRPYLLQALPILKLKKSDGGANNQIDAHQLADMLALYEPSEVSLCLIERGSAMPPIGKGGERRRAGAASSYKNGIGWGIVYGIAVARGFPVELVTPQVWKKAMGAPKDKDGARLRASQLMPWASNLWPLVKDDGKAEAAMIALYADRILQGRARGV